MVERWRRREVLLPSLLQRRSSDEFAPLPWGRRDLRALAALDAAAPALSAHGLARHFASRTGTAAALRALNEAWGGPYYDVPRAAAEDPDAAAEAFAGGGAVVDVQTHYVAQERADASGARAILDFIRSVAPDRWRGLDGAKSLSLAEYLRHVYLESETAVAVLTAAPGEDAHNILPNPEIAGTRELLDRLGGSGRLLHHAIVHPNLPGELAAMEDLRERFRPDGWKVYTLYAPGAAGAWRLDDERVGLPFLARARELGVPLVCAHKGLSQLAPGGSPDDVGPAAAAFPELSFLVYHAGYEVPRGDAEEGPYDDTAPPSGTDRLVRSLRGAGVAPGANVYAELGSTWTLLVRRPREAAHVLGKLLRAVGEDNVLWGTDSVWYGSPQPLIDAFRAFRIPAELCERHGYPALTAERKRKILGANAARVYGLDLSRAEARARGDGLGWARAALAHYRARGTPIAARRSSARS